MGAIIATLEFIGGVPRLLVPDQPRELIANPDAYEPVTARLMQGLGEHYGVAVLTCPRARGGRRTRASSSRGESGRCTRRRSPS